MNVLRMFARVDTEGKVLVPSHIQRETGLKRGQLIELRIIRAGKKKILAISAKNNAR